MLTMADSIAITRFRGDTDPLVFTFTKNGSPVNLTDSTFTLSVSPESAPTEASYILQLQGVISEPATGVVTFTPLESQVNFVGSNFYDIEMVKGAVIKTVLTGKFKMVQDITK